MLPINQSGLLFVHHLTAMFMHATSLHKKAVRRERYRKIGRSRNENL
jgi:hypothetical protein